MKEIKRINTVVISTDEKSFEIIGFTNSNILISPFIEEMRNMGAELNREADKLTVSGVSRSRLYSCVAAYFGAGQSLSSSQKKWKIKIVDEMYESLDMIFKRDDDGVFIVDPHQLHGTVEEIKRDLKKEGIEVVKVVNRKRIYLDLPVGESPDVVVPKKAKKSTKKPAKKSEAVDNKNLVEGDVVKYIGDGFDGFSKFNPNAVFSEYSGDKDAIIIYKKNKVMVDVKHITRKS